jgi:glucose/arabinose dehydrogenase
LTFKHSSTVAKGALLFSALLTFAAANSLFAQQAQAPAITAPATPAPAAAPATTSPAPHASPLFDRSDANAPTIAAAQADHSAAMVSGDNHTIVVSTLVLVLAVVILVLLIA